MAQPYEMGPCLRRGAAVQGARPVRTLSAFRLALMISVAAYLLAMVAVKTSAIRADAAMLFAVLAVWGIALSALGCVVAQIAFFISHKRSNGNG